MTIGSLHTARMLHEHFNVNQKSRAPKGFNRIGEGSYRAVYLEKATNLVYKVGNYDANIEEWNNYRALRRKGFKRIGFDLRIPKTYAYPSLSHYSGLTGNLGVVVQEFAANASTTYCASSDTWMDKIPDCNCKSDICFTTVHERINKFTGIEDIHGENILIDKSKTFWLVDLAM
jgi:hypothetical protein